MSALEKLFNAEQKHRLSDAIAHRTSCRTYADPLSAADWAALSFAAGRYVMPGAHLILTRVEESLFTGTLLTAGRVTGCRAVAVVIASSAVTRNKVHAGILGESFCLEAVSMNLATCWITGTYKKKQLAVPLQPGEAILGIIAVGHPACDAVQPANRRRKPIERLCQSDIRTWPEEIRRAARAVQMAPSAMNLQPWSMDLVGSKFLLDVSDRAQLDLGIAMCHAELLLQSPHTWHFGSTWREPAAWSEANP